MGMALTGYSMPIFWWGLLLIMFFSVELGWTPVSGRIALIYFFEPVTGFMLIDSLLSGQQGAFRSALSPSDPADDRARHHPARRHRPQTRSAMLEVLGEDYVRTARAKGLSPLRVVGLHALRNALIPVVTSIGLQVGYADGRRDPDRDDLLLAGHRQVDDRFDLRRDYPAVQGGLLLIASVVMLVNLIVDLLYGLDQSAHPPWPLTSPIRRSPVPVAAASAASAAPRSGLYSRENRGAVARPRRPRCSSSSLAVFADFVAPHRPIEQFRDFVRCRRSGTRAAPGRFLLGTDAVGRDILSRLIYGARISLFIGLSVMVVSVVRRHHRSAWSPASPRHGRRVIMRLMDYHLAFPSLLLALVLVAILGPGLVNAMIAIAIVFLPHYVRLDARGGDGRESTRTTSRPRGSPAPGRCG